MANYRLKLSDGTTTIDLFGGSDSVIREGGLNMPPPVVRANYVSNPFIDGARLATSKYDNRVITLTTKIWGSSLSDLKTNIRSIHRLLNDAEKRTLSGYGAQVYLEYQWGDTNNQSTYFDVLRGDLAMPANYLSTPLSGNYYILNAPLILTCKPLGRYKNQTIGSDTLENSQSAFDIQVSYLTGDDSQFTIDHANDWIAQTFRTDGSFDVKKVGLKLYIGAGDPEDLTIAIYDISAGDPNNSLVSGTVDITGKNTSAATAEWVYVTFSSAYTLSASTQYAIVAHAPAAAVGKEVYIRYDAGDGDLANGNRKDSTNGGSSWNDRATDDHVFALFKAEEMENYQDIPTSETYGDVPAKMYHKLSQTDAAETTKVWIAKRSGTRYDDDLWIEGEDLSSFTDIIGTARNEILRPNAAGDECNIESETGAACPNHYLNVDEVIADEDTTRVTTNEALYERDIYEIASHVSGTGTINYVRVYARCIAYGPGVDQASLKLVVKAGAAGGAPDTPDESAEKTLTLNIWTNEYNDWATNPKTAAAWTWQEIDLIQAGIALRNPDSGLGGVSSCTQVWVVVNYEIAALDATIIPEVGCSSDVYAHFSVGDATAGQELARFNYTISTLPKGQFRVLARLRVNSEDTDAYDHIGFGIGWIYGDKTKAPNNDLDEYYTVSEDNIWEIIDLGVLNLPPIAESDIASNSSLELSLYTRSQDTLTASEYYYSDVDYIFLLPIDEGVVIINDIATADLIAIDGITDPANVFILSATDKIEDYPDYVGKPFTLGREDTRIYVLRNDDKDMTFTSDITYQPQFLVI